MKHAVHFQLTLLLFVAGVYQSYAQVPSIRWSKCVGGTGYEQANALVQLRDGSFLMTGLTTTPANATPQTPQTLFWAQVGRVGNQRQFQFTTQSAENAGTTVCEAPDGNFVVAGYTYGDGGAGTNRGSADAWVFKTDKRGNLIWNRLLGGSGYDSFQHIMATNDGGYLLTGITESTDFGIVGNHGGRDILLVKLDANGQTQWQRCLGGSEADAGYSALVNNRSDGYIVAGITASNNGDVGGNHGQTDVWVAETDRTGTIRWQRCLGGTGAEGYTSGNSGVGLTSFSKLGGYLFTTSTTSANGDVTGNMHPNANREAWVGQLSNTGVLTAQRCFGGSETDALYSVVKMPGGGFTLAGYTTSSDGDVSKPHSIVDADYWLVRLDAAGQFVWEKSVGSGGLDLANTLTATPDGTVIVAGSAAQANGDVPAGNGGVDAWVLELGKPTDRLTARLRNCYPLNGSAQDGVGNQPGTTHFTIPTANRGNDANAALAFDGTSSYVDLGTSVWPSTTYSVGGWVYLNVWATNENTLFSGSSENDMDYVSIYDNADTRGWRWSATVSGVEITSFINAGSFNWHHVILTRSENAARLFIDGVLRDEKWVPQPSVLVASRQTLIGARPVGTGWPPTSTTGSFFSGMIDDVQFYEGALTENQVADLYQSTSSCPASLTVHPPVTYPLVVDLNMAMTFNKQAVAPNEPTQVTLHVTNAGPLPATNVTILNRLPTSLSLVAPGDLLQSANGLLYGKIARIEPGVTQRIQYTVKPMSTGTFINAAEIVEVDQADADSQPDTGTQDGEDDMAATSLRTTVINSATYVSPNPNGRYLPEPLTVELPVSYEQADLSLKAYLWSRTLSVDQSTVLNITIDNRGGLAATGMQVRVTPSAGVRLVSTAGAEIMGSVIMPISGSIAAAQSLTRQLTIRGKQAGSATVTVELISADQTDPDSVPGNGLATGEDDTVKVDLRVRD